MFDATFTGTSRALDLLMSARVVKSDEALALGLVNFVVPKDEVVARARAYATDLALNVSPASMVCHPTHPPAPTHTHTRSRV